MAGEKLILSESYDSIRRRPINLLEGDISLFQHEFSKRIPQVNVLRAYNVFVVYGNVFSLPNTIYTEYTSSSKSTLSITQVIRSLAHFLLNSRFFLNSAVWIIDGQSSAYFHWLTDALPRLMACMKVVENPTVLLPNHFADLPYVRESLEIIGIRNVRYYKCSTFVREMFLASHTAPSGNFNTNWIHEVAKSLSGTNISVPRSKKLFISRKYAPKRMISNEEVIQSALERHGFDIIYMEHYKLSEQIALMQQAKVVVGLHGAGLTNIMFMPPGGKVLEIRNKRDKHNNCFFALASEFSHEYYYLLAEGNGDDTLTFNAMVDVNAFEVVLKSMC